MRTMRVFLISLGLAGAVGFVALLAYLAHAGGVPVLAPSGAIGLDERSLMIHTVLLMLIVAVPVYLLIGIIAWKYRAGATAAKYTPDWENSPMEEFIWWIIPFEIVLVLGALTWTGTHALAPEKAIQSTQKPEVVQVVALPWKWLFIYPEEGVATVNELALPAGRPVSFEITAAAPMNSFWIPALGGQMYAMTGMVTRLNLISENPGEFTGRSANYSGEGFAGMQFPVHVLAKDDWTAWINRAYASSASLTPDTYAALAAPSENAKTQLFGSVTMPFTAIVGAYMTMPEMDMSSMHR
ncbi:MAG TPA: COX aromatic rich motif-containing protein [Candidatus Paceibacterota bacterium]|nr:COX aromatic rich motif-containing protein [Candidatus Paceibacterota bacterium]